MLTIISAIVLITISNNPNGYGKSLESLKKEKSNCCDDVKDCGNCKQDIVRGMKGFSG